jgi:hypothetical protein
MAKPLPNPYLTTESPDALEPLQRLAYDIVAVRRDLVPSVERIMVADIGDARLDALQLFQQSIGEAGDPNRNPAVAITSALARVDQA